MLEICWELGAATFSGTSITRLKPDAPAKDFFPRPLLARQASKPVPPERVDEIIEHDKLNQ